MMFKSLLSRLSDPAPALLSAEEAELAIAVLLVRLARADDSYEASEKERIDRVLAARGNLGPWEAAQLRRQAEAIEREAPDTVRFTRTIKDRIPHDDRIGVIEALWDVALVDDARSAEEDALIRLAANLLGINDRESALARQRVEARRS
ncbi:TerB family tellurite resistance protein [Sinirhodobacter populi]|uniref:TerB family tellurite resistance protein n=2 Tax=Paenirhodobacter populi TaxID=2306993 RepID=A0A443K878_9RHOB|nr:TerB family tellurite resistance protein [Sinirhodobacter populi]